MFLELFEAEIVFYALRALMSNENSLQSNCESHLKFLIILKQCLLILLWNKIDLSEETNQLQLDSTVQASARFAIYEMPVTLDSFETVYLPI